MSNNSKKSDSLKIKTGNKGVIQNLDFLDEAEKLRKKQEKKNGSKNNRQSS